MLKLIAKDLALFGLEFIANREMTSGLSQLVDQLGGDSDVLGGDSTSRIR